MVAGGQRTAAGFRARGEAAWRHGRSGRLGGRQRRGGGAYRWGEGAVVSWARWGSGAASSASWACARRVVREQLEMTRTWQWWEPPVSEAGRLASGSARLRGKREGVGRGEAERA